MSDSFSRDSIEHPGVNLRLDEADIRRRLRTHGYVLHKADAGEGFMVTASGSDEPEFGAGFEATLEEVDAWIAERE